MTKNVYEGSKVKAQCNLDLNTSARLRLSEDISCFRCEEDKANPEQPKPSKLAIFVAILLED